MQFVALDDLNRGLQLVHDAVCERLARVTAIDQHALHQLQIRLPQLKTILLLARAREN
jgi:hypothetical protein